MPIRLLTLLALLPLAAAAAEPAPAYPRPELLVEPADLARPEVARGLRVLDARPREKYAAGHVPGAVRVDLADWEKGFGEGKDADAWGRRLAAVGVDPDTRVVVYDDNFGKDAARVWWILRYWGVKDVRLLNGGWKGWTQAKGEVTQAETPVPALKPVKLEPLAKRLATKGQLLEELKGTPPQIVDARSEGEFCGEAATAKRNGAIPGARHLEWIDLIDKTSGRFKPAPELAKLFEAAGIDPRKPTTTYCQSGGRASVMAFGLELMGSPEVRNYYRSWSEWGNDPDTPVVQPKK